MLITSAKMGIFGGRILGGGGTARSLEGFYQIPKNVIIVEEIGIYMQSTLDLDGKKTVQL